MSPTLTPNLIEAVQQEKMLDPSLKEEIIAMARRAERHEKSLQRIESAVTHSYQPLSDIISILIDSMKECTEDVIF